MLTLQPVLKQDGKVLYNLYSLYLHDLSAYTPNLNIEEDGSFKLDVFDSIWDTEGLSPFFIKLDKSIVGFILLVERPFLKKEYDFSVNDIFILNKYRGMGFGLEALELVFRENKGKYFVIELKTNQPAVLFWKKVYIKLGIEFNEQETVIDEDPVLIQTFELS